MGKREIEEHFVRLMQLILRYMSINNSYYFLFISVLIF